MRKNWTFLIILLGVTVSFTGCLIDEGDQGSEIGTIIDVVAPPVAIDPSTLVCSPFGDGPTAGDRTQGVLASLYYLDDTQPRYRTADEYIDNGHHVDQLSMYFNQIFVPTRPFDRGFTTQSGTTVLTPTGDTLYEYFALKFEGQIHLGENDLPGQYQFAILSDDGSVLELDLSGQLVTPQVGPAPANGVANRIDNDGNHPTRFKCGAEPVQLDRDTKIPFVLKYYQGPRYHISMIVLWREWSGDGSDPECNQQGNSRYFDYRADPPTPTASYNNLLARGWKVLGADNYSLPAAEGENPCNEVAPTIIEYGLVGLTSTSVTIAWSTDIASTSKLQWIDVATGEEGETALDLNMVTNHQMGVTGLKPNTVYTLRAISGSSSGLLATSPDISVRTSR